MAVLSLSKNGGGSLAEGASTARISFYDQIGAQVRPIKAYDATAKVGYEAQNLLNYDWWGPRRSSLQ